MLPEEKERGLNKVLVLCISILFLIAVKAFGMDLGVIMSITPDYREGGSSEGSSVNGTVSPWLSGMLQEELFYQLTMNVSMNYDGELETPPLFELGRAELNWRPFPTMMLTGGRQRFRDGTGLVASGLFDGFSGSLGLGWGRISLGVFYTGLLYKKNAEIIMTEHDLANYIKPLDYGNPTSYFASRRILTTLAGEFPDLTSHSTLRLDLLAQIDLNDTSPDTAYALHSQYLLGQYTFRPVEMLVLNASGGMGITEIEGADTQISFAATAGADWELPTSLTDMLSAKIIWSSGSVSNTIGVFRPINGITQGMILTPKFSALASAKASYATRLHETLSAETGFTYFLRTDVETFYDEDLDPASTSRLLGGEVYGSVIWAPESICRFTLSGGLFFPKLGSAFKADTPVRWKISGGIILSF
jgi:hypothetical protein